MACSQAKSDLKQTGRQSIRPRTQGKQPRGIEKQRPQKSTRKVACQKETLHQRKESKDKDTEPEHPFPSPSTSNTPSKEAPQSSRVLPKATDSLERPQRSTLDSSPEEFQHPCYQNGHKTGRQLDRKRKRSRSRSQEAESPTSRVQEKSVEKRARTSIASRAVKDKEAASNNSHQSEHPINHWIQEGNWPEKYFESDPNMSQQLSRKHSSSGISYRQSVKEGDNPPAYTPEYEGVLAKAGIFMYQHLGHATISDTSKELCTTLLDADYEPPKHTLFQGDFFWITLDRVRSRNEARVVRDITPYIVPSAEILFTRGVSGLEYLTEEINAEWSKCIPLAGPQPKPDFAVGLPQSAFTDNEIEKLKYYRAPQKPTSFTGNLYFPFLLCEVKCGENGLNIADRQNAHSASMAVNAILQLHREEGESSQEPRTVSRAEEFHRKILVFSISHDHTSVKIYGHYALIKGDKTTFHRHLIHSFDFTAYDGKNKWTAYEFVRKVYDHFAPIHLKRIQSAVAQLPDPKSDSFMSIISTENDSELADSQETMTNAPSSRDTAGFKKPRLPPKVMLQQKVDQQMEQIDEMKDRVNQLLGQVDILKQQTPSNASTSESELQREHDRLKDQLKQQENQFMLLLQQQQTLANASTSESMLQQENGRLRQEMKEQAASSNARIDQLMELLKQQAVSFAESQRRLAQEKEESQQRHTELMKQLKVDNDRKNK